MLPNCDIITTYIGRLGMLRKIIKIDEALCNGCGLCAAACHEGAIGMVNGKAKLLRDDYCDGLGDCLPSCPTKAISFEMREALAYDEAAVQAHMQSKGKTSPCASFHAPITFASHKEETKSNLFAMPAKPEHKGFTPVLQMQNNANNQSDSKLYNWPVQIKLAPTNAPFFNGAKLLVAATCSAFSYGSFHEDFIKNHVVLIGCPKLDGVDYAEKLAEIIAGNDIQSVHCVRMEVPCCSGLESAVKKALQQSGKFIPWHVSVLGRDGNVVETL